MESRMKVECRPTKTRTQSNITHPDKQRTKTRFSSMEPFKMVCSIRILIEVFCSSVCISGDPFPLSVGHHKEVGKHSIRTSISIPSSTSSLPPSRILSSFIRSIGCHSLPRCHSARLNNPFLTSELIMAHGVRSLLEYVSGSTCSQVIIMPMSVLCQNDCV